MSIDEQHVALPKLYGAPAYARPPRHAPADERPFDPDELPIEAYQTDEEHEFAELARRPAPTRPAASTCARTAMAEHRDGNGLPAAHP